MASSFRLFVKGTGTRSCVRFQHYTKRKAWHTCVPTDKNLHMNNVVFWSPLLFFKVPALYKHEIPWSQFFKCTDRKTDENQSEQSHRQAWHALLWSLTFSLTRLPYTCVISYSLIWNAAMHLCDHSQIRRQCIEEVSLIPRPDFEPKITLHRMTQTQSCQVLQHKTRSVMAHSVSQNDKLLHNRSESFSLVSSLPLSVCLSVSLPH